jgi:hypothetical protein
VALRLVQAAHLVPFCVTKDNSTDNGVALCPNHHVAFDSELVAFAEDRRIYVNVHKVRALKAGGHGAGIDGVIKTLRDNLAPCGIDQAAKLKMRFDMNTQDSQADWELISKVRGSI